MRKNLYTKTINDIKISENAVNSAIENIYSKQSNDNIIDIKKSKNKKVNKVIAASLVAAMLVSGGAFALFSQPAQNQNGFVITAAAAELTKDKPVQVAAIDRTDRYFYGYESYEETFNLLLSCKGDNISTITYNAKGNSYFTFNTDDNEKVYCGKVLSDFENKNADETMKIYMNSGADYFYSGFTVDYDKQDESVKVDSDGVAPVSMNVYLMANDSEKAAKILSKYNAYSLYSGEAVSDSVKAEYIEKNGENFDKEFNPEYDESDIIDMYNELYSQLFEGVSVDVTVKYNDGTEETQTVDFNVEPITEETADEHLKENGYNGERNSLYNLLGSCATITATLR